MRPWLDAAADLVIGAHCPGCARPGLGICRRCAARLRPIPRAVPLPGADLKVVAAGHYSGVAERVVRCWKGAGHREAASWAAHAVAACVAGLDVDHPILVPVPATRRSRRQRGGWLVDDLSRDAAALTEHLGLSVTVAHPVRLRRQTKDQRGLGLAGRARNTRGAFVATAVTSRRPVIVVDDVVTTGATLQAVTLALRASGWHVHSAVAALATPPPGRRRSALVNGAAAG